MNDRDWMFREDFDKEANDHFFEKNDDAAELMHAKEIKVKDIWYNVQAVTRLGVSTTNGKLFGFHQISEFKKQKVEL